ncbi:MAG: protein kinase [Deltaproteobacteria bacterium]|nr:protein kinase [Deltaproteobacteria bacterium]
MSTLPVNSDFGNYFIMRHIGGGGMAQIYQAKTKGLAGFEKTLALKVINPEYANEKRFIDMLVDEAKITVNLAHANIAQVFDLGECNGIYYIAMEFVDGLDVLELVNGMHAMQRRLPVEAVAYIGRQICSGLHYAHTRKDHNGKARNLVHRDISPQNVLVSRNGEVKVVDFGIAKAAGMSSKTQAGVIKGKVNYMAPEQVMGQSADPRTDIFSVGVVLWESLTASMVYSADNMGELVVAVRKAEIAAPSTKRPEIPPALDAIILRALHPNRMERFQTAHELQVELTKFLSNHAPDYSGSDVALLVEKALAPREHGSESKDDEDDVLDLNLLSSELQDHHSLIFSPMLEPQLIVLSEGREEVHSIGESLTIGRAGELAIADARISRKHAKITRMEHGSFVVEDLGSSNGTFVNDRRVHGQQPLRPGDRIRIGGCRIRFATGIENVDAAPDPVPPKQPDCRLSITIGDKHIERKLEGDIELGYQLQLGPLELGGVSGKLVQRDGGYWIEPGMGGRLGVMFRGKRASQAQRLTSGDRFEIGGVSFRYEE